MVYERLILDATVLDNFSDELDELEERLDRIDNDFRGVLQDDVDVDIGADIDSEIDILEDALGIETGGGVADEAVTSGGRTDPFERDPDRLLASGVSVGGFSAGVMENAEDALGTLFDGDGPSDTFGMDRGERRRALGQFRDITLTMRPFFNLLASMLPMLTTFVAALPAAIAGLTGLAGAALAAAGALGAVGGLAILGMSLRNGEISVRPLEQRITELFNTFVDSFAPVANQLAPLAEDAFDAANRMVRELGRRADFLLSMDGQFRAAFGFIEDTLPSALEETARFASAAMPILAGIGQLFADIDFFGILAGVLRETLPLLATIFSLFGRMANPLFELSRGFLLAATGAAALLGGLLQLLTAIPFLGEGIGIVIGVLLTATTASALFTLVTNSATIALLRFAAGMFTKLIPSVYSAIQAKLAYIGVQRTAIVTTVALTVATATLIGIITFGLGPVLGAMSSLFTGLGNDIDSATQSLKSFNSVAGRTSGMSVGGAVGTDASGQSVGYTDPSSITVVAPDEETGTSLANTLGFTNGETPTQNNVNGRVHRR